MALFTRKEKKNEKEEKDLQTEKKAGKVALDDELLGSVAGGDDIPDDEFTQDDDDSRLHISTDKFKQ